MSNTFGGLNGPNQNALLIQHNMKKAREQVEDEREFEREMMNSLLDGLENSLNSNDSSDWYEGDSIFNAKVNLIKSKRTKFEGPNFNITLTDEQFDKLLEALKE